MGRVIPNLRAMATLAALLFAPFLSHATQAQAPSGIAPDRIVFGQSAAFEGPASFLGRGVRGGLRAAFHEVNASGGVYGREFVLTSYDDGYEPLKAIENTQRLVDDDKVFALIGEVGTPTSQAVQPIAERFGVPFVGPVTGAAFLRNPKLATVVNLRASYDQETEALIDYLTNERKLKRIAVLFQDDSFGRAGLSGVEVALKRRGLAVHADGTYRRNTTAVKRALLSLRKSKPEAIIIVGAYKPAATFIRTAHKIGFEPVFATLSFVGGNALAGELAKIRSHVLVSQVVPRYDDSSLPLVARFQKAMMAGEQDVAQSFVALEGYLLGRFLIEAVRALGPQPDRRSFLKLFRSEFSVDIDGFTLRFGPGDNQGSDKVFLTEIAADGSFRTVDQQK